MYGTRELRHGRHHVSHHDGGQHGVVRRMVGAFEDADHRGVVRIADGRLHDEPVQLSLRQPVRSRLLYGVLRGEYNKRRSHDMGSTIYSDLALLHHLK